MKQAIIIHGTTDAEEYYSDVYPSLSNSHWQPWLQKQLLIRDVHAHAPEMFQAHVPDYQSWKKEFERYDIGPDTVLVGHSCGGGFLVRWLSENSNVHVNKVVLVAPWLDPNKTKGEDNNFFDFQIDKGLVARTEGVTIFHSTDDSDGVCKSVDSLRKNITGVQYREFTDKGHFCLSDLGTEEFPELLEEILA